MTTDQIINSLTEKVNNNIPIGAHEYLSAASSLNVLLGGENETLYKLEFTINQKRAEWLSNPNLDYTSSKAEALVKAMPEYLQMQLQKGRISQIVEMIRLSKHMARLSTEELRSN
jgi:hypothetical protein